MIETVTPAPADYSLWALFLHADVLVKGVMLLLLAASVGCWAVIFEKSVRLALAHRAARHLVRSVRAGDSLEAVIAGPFSGDIVTHGLAAAGDEDVSESRAERRARIERAMRAAMIERLKRLESGIPLLATVGSTAPFVGLFGTVWGIMHSFTAIAASRDTSLAVVAPGIAEALLATALGLIAAIPAVVAYNKLSGSLAALAQRLTLAIGELGERWSRRGTEPTRAIIRRRHTGAPLLEAAE